MNSQTYQKKAVDILALADIRVNGDRPWDVRVNNDALFARVFATGSLGLGESYMDGWFDCDALDVFFDKLLRAELENTVKPQTFLWNVLSAKFTNMQSRRKSLTVAQKHYNIGNDLYAKMLGRTMQYTCGYWHNTAMTLDDAQDQKLELICKKIQLQRGERVLELGGGFGGFAYYAAKHYGAHVTSYNIADEQIAFAKEWCAGLPVDIVKSDYRDAKGTFDKVVSIGMAEHVGPKNYRELMQVAHRCLVPGGLFLCHTIAGNESATKIDPWIDTYIFPHAVLPSTGQFGRSFEKLFVMEDWHNFGPDYDKTLLAWCANFEANWPSLKTTYDERFYRMWKYYLLSCAGTFRARKTQLWQVVLSKGHRSDTYESVR